MPRTSSYGTRSVTFLVPYLSSYTLLLTSPFASQVFSIQDNVSQRGCAQDRYVENTKSLTGFDCAKYSEVQWYTCGY